MWHTLGQQNTNRGVLGRSSGEVFTLLIEETSPHSPHFPALNVGIFLYLSQLSSYYEKATKKITEMMTLTLLGH